MKLKLSFYQFVKSLVLSGHEIWEVKLPRLVKFRSENVKNNWPCAQMD